jgi:hypothetical protein
MVVGGNVWLWLVVVAIVAFYVTLALLLGFF